MPRRAIACSFAALALIACNAAFGVGDLEFGPGTGGGTTSAGGAGGDIVTSSSSSSSSASTSSSGGAGGGGGAASSSSTGGAGGGGGDTPVPVLDDADLVVRYPFDEAAMGQFPPMAIDHAPSPLDLPISYEPVLGYNAVAGNRGLRWTDVDAAGRPQIQLPNNDKVRAALDGATQGTLEAVFDAEAVSNNRSSLWYFNGATQGEFTWVLIPTGFRFYWKAGTTLGEWPLTFPSGRVVAHLVYDSTAPVAADRLRVYVDGVQLNPTLDPNVPPNEAISTQGVTHLTIGNARENDRSFQGTMYYMAFYATAFDDTRLEEHVAALTLDDDS